ncbi:MAG: PepSY domain-containing protein, partial [Planctomycetota bacterium]
DEDDDDEDEEQVSIDQVPAVVKATILKEAQGGTIKEIERETEDGKTLYEAEVIINGQEVEIEVAADGTLLGKEVEDEDDDD